MIGFADGTFVEHQRGDIPEAPEVPISSRAQPVIGLAKLGPDTTVVLRAGGLLLLAREAGTDIACAGCAMLEGSPDGSSAIAAGGRTALILAAVEPSPTRSAVRERVSAQSAVPPVPIRLAHGAEVTAVALSDTIAVTGGADGIVRLWDAGTGAPLGRVRGHKDAVSHLTITAGGRLVSASLDGEVRVSDVAGIRLGSRVDLIAATSSLSNEDPTRSLPSSATPPLAAASPTSLQRQSSVCRIYNSWAKDIYRYTGVDTATRLCKLPSSATPPLGAPSPTPLQRESPACRIYNDWAAHVYRYTGVGIPTWSCK